MADQSPLFVAAEGVYWFHCPACRNAHQFQTARSGKTPAWSWDGELMRPTVQPSLRVTAGPGNVCHFFIRNGMLEYCHDSTHALAGQVVSMEPWEGFDSKLESGW